MPIVLAAEDPPTKNLSLPDVLYQVGVKTDWWEDAWVHRATCQTFDEAIELIDAYRKWYYVHVETVPARAL